MVIIIINLINNDKRKETTATRSQQWEVQQDSQRERLRGHGHEEAAPRQAAPRQAAPRGADPWLLQ